MMDVTVVGGINVDISCQSHAGLVLRDSNPGAVRVSMGGVGRNIAENLARLGLRARLTSVFGGDAFADMARASCRELGIDTASCVTADGARSCLYVSVLEPDGDMAVAVNDMSACDALSPDALLARMDAVNDARAVLAEANLREDTLRCLAEHCTRPLFAECVSSVKCVRLRGILRRLEALKCNKLEAETLSGVPITDDASLARAAEALLAAGVRRVFITLGARGAYWADSTPEGVRGARLPAFPAPEIVSTTGCGDAFMAAALCAFLQGKSTREMACAGLSAAAVCIGSADAVSPALAPERLRFSPNEA